MHKLAGILIVAAASMTAATCLAAVSPGARPSAAGSSVVLVRGGGMEAGGFGGMNPGGAGGMNQGGAGGMNSGGMGMNSNGVSGSVGFSSATRSSACAPSLWSRVFGSPDKGLCAAQVRASARTIRSNTRP